MVWLYKRMPSISILHSLSEHVFPIYSIAWLFFFFQHPSTLHIFPYRLLPATWAIIDQREEGREKIPHISPDSWRLKLDLLLSSGVAAVGRELSPLTLPPLVLLLTFLFLSLEIKGNGGGGQEAGGWTEERRDRQTGTGGKHLRWQMSNGYSCCQPRTRT